jgi:aminoglycoside phosphotransferase (APT) family kinase protein
MSAAPASHLQAADGAVAEADLAGALGQALGGRVDGVQRLSGGASQETWAFTLHPTDGAQDDRRLVLRRAPPGAAQRAADSAGLAAEAALIAIAARAGVPVPALVRRLQAGDGLGDGFITAWLAGETLGRRLAAAHRPALAAQCGTALARLHALPLAGLPPLRRTQPRAEVAHLRAWHARHGTVRPVFQLALRWLDEQAPPDARPTLVHGDFRNGNLMVDLADDRLLAVLDWELAHIGDPMADLGWLTVHSWRFGQPQRPVGGFGHWPELLGAYRAAGGTVDVARLRWWQVLGTLRWGVICESMGAAWLSGAEPVMEKAAIARRASETEIDLLHLLAPAGATA